MAAKAQREGRQKHVPRRTCVVCRQQREKRSLTRVVRNADGTIMPDETGKRPGRGAYLCDNPACWQSAIAGEALAAALRTPITPDDRKRLAAAAPASPANADEEPSS